MSISAVSSALKLLRYVTSMAYNMAFGVREFSSRHYPPQAHYARCLSSMSVYHYNRALALILACLAMEGRLTADVTKRDIVLMASREHLERFRSLRIHYQLRQGHARSVEDGLAGRFADEPEPVEAAVTLSVLGRFFRLDVKYRPKDVERYTQKSGNMIVQRYSDQTLIWNDEVAVVQNSATQFLVDRSEIRRKLYPHPINVGMGEALFQRAQLIRSKSNGAVHYIGEEQLKDRTVTVLDLQWHDAGFTSQRDRYYLDAERGYTPLRIETFLNAPDSLSHIIEVIEVGQYGNDRWLPQLFRIVTTGTAHRFSEVRVHQIEVDAKLSPEDFVLKPTDHRMGYNVLTKQQLITRTGRVPLTAFRSDGTLLPNPDIEVWTPGSQRNLATSTSAKVDRPPATSEVAQWPFGPQPDDSTTRWWLAALAAVLAIAAIVIWRLKKK